MKITLSTSPLNLNDASADWVEERLAGIGERRRIDEAIVKVTRHPEASPAWEIFIHLVTPGPDLTATARDHTLAAAFAKNLAGLEDILDAREAKRAGRQRNRGPSHPPAAYPG
jgi:ribosome-associated translation inhibitor RaiA